jgi:hypothetical protein
VRSDWLRGQPISEGRVYLNTGTYFKESLQRGMNTAYQMDWAAKKNGELLLIAKEFGVFHTVD